MRLFLSIVLFIVLFFGPKASAEENSTPINFAQALIFFSEQIAEDTPESFQYIHLNYTSIIADSPLEDALQILVYHNKIENIWSPIHAEKLINIAQFSQLSDKILGVKVSDNTPEYQRNQAVTHKDLEDLKAYLQTRNAQNSGETQTQAELTSDFGLWKHWEILEDVYETLKREYYNKESLDDEKLLEGAIQWLVDQVGDKYTSYFPPIESKNFISSLDGEFDGIWAYVDMPTPWELIIVTPIVGSPAEKAGLKGGDRVLKVDEQEISPDTSLNEAISWIKGPKGTSVLLHIERTGVATPLKIQVKRDTIIIHDIEYSKLESDTFYIQIKSFWDKVDSEFLEVLQEIQNDYTTGKIIFDLRNNPGWYLDRVTKMLWFFVEKGEPTAIVNQGGKDYFYKSKGEHILSLQDYEVIILQNTWSASASEIFAGSLKDYFPEITIIGEQSFGKGSVQSLKNYYNGSTLKYTTALWFTGKNRNSINHIGIQPDIELPFDFERFAKFKVDNQLEAALDL
jgi:C-terminal peptidase prc